MDLKMAVLVVFLASLFLVDTARVSQDVEEHFLEIAIANPPAHAPTPTPPPPIIVDDPKECGGACKGRCALHSRPNVCNRACVTCCSQCRCVPPGTYGNKELCGTCYSNWLTHGNRTKCP